MSSPSYANIIQLIQETIVRKIQQLQESHYDDYVDISLNAYPGINIRSTAEKEQFRHRAMKMQADATINLYGVFEQEVLLGVMRLYDFQMKLHNRMVFVGGIGGVAVHLLHKKQKVAYDMVQFFLTHYKERGACLTALYPFRPDFYKQMGFGYGRKLDQYCVKPHNLPSSGKRKNVTLLSAQDRSAFIQCYQRYLAQTNGLMEWSNFALDTLFSASALKIAGYWQDGTLRGYLIFQFEPVAAGNFLRNNIVVRTIVFENRDALHGLLSFLHSQADQIDEVIVHTQEPDFHYLLSDPRNGQHPIMPPVFQQSNVQGVGIMYRVIDLPRFFFLLQEHNFGSQSCHVRFFIADTFFPENAGSYDLVFVNGRIQHQATLSSQPQVEIHLDVSDFSSLVIGATTFKQLYRLGCVQISNNNYVETIHNLFYTEQKPMCMTSF